jgi:hypothetical protein
MFRAATAPRPGGKPDGAGNHDRQVPLGYRHWQVPVDVGLYEMTPAEGLAPAARQRGRPARAGGARGESKERGARGRDTRGTGV